MTQQQEQLYPDSRIYKELGVVHDAQIDYASSFHVGLDGAIGFGKAIRDTYEAALAARDERIKELQAQVDAAKRYVTIEEDERLEVCESHFNREAGDSSSRYFAVWLSSTAIMFDNDSMIEIPNTHE